MSNENTPPEPSTSATSSGEVIGCSVSLAEENHKSVLDTIKDRGWTELPECIKSSNLRILSTSASLEKTE